jgi:hypothetical protein
VDEVHSKLKDLSNILLPPSRRVEKPETLSLLDLSIDDAVYILQHLRKYFFISSQEEQQRLLTMLPPSWGRDRSSNWFGSSNYQARCSIALRSNTGIFSNAMDHRGNKSLDSETELMVYNFYTSDDNSRETSYKKQVIHALQSRDPIPLRFLHLTIGETFERFKLIYPDANISRSKFFSLRPIWVKEKTPHESCLCLHHANTGLLLQVSESFFLKFHLNFCILGNIKICSTFD